ncbi:MAG: hypothetical protein E7457_07365 [Ruminococcaceae bacterium]|nr:hypothetical protein [Oscillospiraceae bacterium]
MKEYQKIWAQKRKRIHEVVEVGYTGDWLSQGYDIADCGLWRQLSHYPLGKAFSIMPTFPGVGMVAIPTGIISAGFVDQYSRFKRISEYAAEEDIHFIKVPLHGNDSWIGKAVKDLGLPDQVIVAMILRGRETIVPRGDVVLRRGDILVIGAETLKNDTHIDLKEIVLLAHNPWNGQHIRDLDISRQTIIVMVKRKGTMLVPRGSLRLMEGDHVILYTQERILDANIIEV